MTWPAATIVLMVSPSLNAGGERAYSARGKLFDASVDGRRIVNRSVTPFCAAARVLLADGIKPNTILVMRHAGSTADALRSTVGVAAKLTVADSGGKPGFVPWVDLRQRHEISARSGAPKRQNESPASSVPPEPPRVLEVVLPDARTVALGLDVHAAAAGEMVEDYFEQEAG